jgi:cation transport ATPase
VPSGDNARAARQLAGQAGIQDVRAGLLPKDKAIAVQQLEADGQQVLLAGDGINDAPAPAAARTGVALGRAGSDLALDTADAVIMRDDLTAIPAVITLSRRARRVVTANLAIAATIIATLAAWDLAGHLPLPLGVLGHEGSTVIVGLNGLRLRSPAPRSRDFPRQRHMRQGKTPVQQNAPRCCICRGHGSSGTPFRAGGSGLLRG